MKTQMRILAVVGILAAACSKKEDSLVPVPSPAGNTDNYSSMNDFFAQNGVPPQFFTMDAIAGGSFTTPQGTVVTAPANAFITQAGAAVTGNVQIEFKDIYKKSDMLLSDKPTLNYNGRPLKSAGEFFIRAKSGNVAIKLAPGKIIEVEQPAAAAQGSMDAFVLIDTSGFFSWWPSASNSVLNNATSYVYSLYQFSMPADSGSWCNSDNSFFFSAYPQTQLICDPDDDPALYDMNVFLVFNNVNSMIHVYSATVNGNIIFPYQYAPSGLLCTIVAVGVKDGKLYSSFTPVTISNNQTVHFTVSETTTETFKSQLNALN